MSEPRRETRSTKPEIRNKSKIQNLHGQKEEHLLRGFLSFEFWLFEIVSKFEIWISDLGSQECLKIHFRLKR